MSKTMQRKQAHFHEGKTAAREALALMKKTEVPITYPNYKKATKVLGYNLRGIARVAWLTYFNTRNDGAQNANT